LRSRIERYIVPCQKVPSILISEELQSYPLASPFVPSLKPVVFSARAHYIIEWSKV
jgi:hypothetical protein